MPTNSIYDATIRQQLYLEGVKNNEADAFNATEAAIIAIIVALLAKQGVDLIGQMTKRDFRRLKSDVHRRVSAELQKLNSATHKKLRAFLAADFSITKTVFASIAGTGAKAGTAAALWAKFAVTTNPGTGLTTTELITDFMANATREIRKRIGQAYAENMTVGQATALFTGTRANNFKDGYARKMKNQFDATLATAFQAVANYVSFHVSKLYYDQYEWVSVLDSRTTDICRGRDGKRFEYGKGPIPPAHYRCRSRIIPVAVTAGKPVPVKPGITPRPKPVAPIPVGENSFYAWLRRQPIDVQNDILGVTWARALRKGVLSPDQIAGFDTVRKLTIDGYRLKGPQIVA